MGKHPVDIKLIFGEALEKKTAGERAAYLDKVCGNNTDLRNKIEALLKAYEDADDVPEAPIIGSEITLDSAPLTEGPGTKIGHYKLLQRIGEGGFVLPGIDAQIITGCPGGTRHQVRDGNH